jgi:hypothetical protein
MSDDQQTPPRAGRRSSFAGQTFADLFGTGRSSMSRSTGNDSPPPTQQMPGPISQAAAQAQRRRLSLTTLGLSGSPNQTSPFGSFRGRNDSIGSANSGSIDESAIAEDEGAAAPANNGSAPGTPFARRTSFGARALRDIRTNSFGGGGSGSGGPGSPGQNGTKSPPASNSKPAAPNGTISSREAKGRGLSLAPALHYLTSSHSPRFEDYILTCISAAASADEGFNWSDNFRNRAQRTSIAAQGGLGAPSAANNHARSKSVAVMDPPPAAAMPKPKEQKRPDHFQERILKGDFYMD